MDQNIADMQQKLDALTKTNAELYAWKLEYNAHKQSVQRMSARLHKLCKRLTPSTETTSEMLKIAADIKTLAREATSKA